MLQKDNLFSRREETNFRPIAPAPAVAAAIAERSGTTLFNPPLPPTPVLEPVRTSIAAKPGEGSKLIVGPDVKLKGVEITDCDTLVVEGRVESALDSRVIQIA